MSDDPLLTNIVRARFRATLSRLSRWRMGSRETIMGVIDEAMLDRKLPSSSITRDFLLRRIDAAYPFGARRHHPYKAWLKERALFVQSFEDDPSMQPTADDAAACEVAADMLEARGPEAVDEVKALLAEQAPNRLTLPCPACGAKAGTGCSAISPDDNEPGSPHVAIRIVPHMARVRPSSGPLFGEVPR